MSQAADTMIQSAFTPPSGSVFTFLVSTGMHVKSLLLLLLSRFSRVRLCATP